MMYEISKESFKQRIENPLNFAFVSTSGAVEGIETTEASSLKEDQNILIFSLNSGDTKPSDVAKELDSKGYQFVYYYQGSEADKLFIGK